MAETLVVSEALGVLLWLDEELSDAVDVSLAVDDGLSLEVPEGLSVLLAESEEV